VLVRWRITVASRAITLTSFFKELRMVTTATPSPTDVLNERVEALKARESDYVQRTLRPLGLADYDPAVVMTPLFGREARRDRAILRALDAYMKASFTEGVEAGEVPPERGSRPSLKPQYRLFAAMDKRHAARLDLHAALVRAQAANSIIGYQRLEADADSASKKAYMRGVLEGAQRRGASASALAALREGD
jgi:hypothetical protein